MAHASPGLGCQGWGGTGGGDPAAAGGDVSVPQHTNCPAASWTCDQTLPLRGGENVMGLSLAQDI